MKERLKDMEMISASSQDGITGTRFTLPYEIIKREQNIEILNI